MAILRTACPRCGREVVVDDAVPLPPDHPFCSERCRMSDLNKWLEGEYRISRPLRPGDGAPPPED